MARHALRNPRGLTTGPIPYGRTTFDISFDLLENRLAVTTGENGAFSSALDGLPVAESYRRLFERLRTLGISDTTHNKYTHSNDCSRKVAGLPQS